MVLVVIVMSALLLAGCEDSSSAQDKENQTKTRNYEGLQNKQPAQSMDYSPTRETINFWMDTWEEEGKISYVYLLASNGQEIGYYVFEGLPVSYCASLTPTYERKNGYDRDHIVDAPAMDGVWYSGGQCNQYYGKDAGTGSFIEFTIGGSQSYLLTEQPLPKPDVEPLTATTIEDVQEDN